MIIQQGLFPVLCHISLISDYSSMKLMVSIMHSSKGKKAQKLTTVKEEPQDDTRRLTMQTMPPKPKPKSKSKVKVKPEPDVIKDEDRSDAAACSDDEDMIRMKKRE